MADIRNADQLRSEIDRDRASEPGEATPTRPVHRVGDTGALLDPAAAPMHTDQEASDTPTPPSAIRQDARAQARASATIPQREPTQPWVWGLGGLAALVAAAVVLFAVTSPG